MATPAGFEATRYLIASKLAGQASVAKGRLSETGAATTIARLRDELEAAETLEEIRHVEAVAANVYWNAWSEIEVPFVRKDVSRVADHWRTFEGRRSAVNVGTSRSATDPANALLNYGYRLLEAEGRFACLAVGLDPGLGILHADLKGRDSMVLDIMEAVRPVVDGYVLDLFRARPLMKTDFAEDRRGVLRVLPPLTHRIAEAMPAWGKALAPVVEHVARILSTSSPYDVSVPSVLTRDKHKAAAARRVAAPAHSTQSGVLSPGPNPGGLAPRVKQRQRPSVSADRPCPVGLAAGADRSWPPWNRTMPRLDAGGATSVDRSAEPSWTTGCERRRASSQIGIVWRPTCSRRTPMKPSHAAGTRTGGASSPDLPGKQTTTVRRPTSVGTPNTSPRAWRICPSPRSPGRSASPRPQRASSEGACVFRRRDTGQHFPN
jgi:hypothetical protein